MFSVRKVFILISAAMISALAASFNPTIAELIDIFMGNMGF